MAFDPDPRPDDERWKVDAEVSALRAENASLTRERDEAREKYDALRAEVEALRESQLARVQREHRAWVEHNFPGRDWTQPFMGIVEEVGELSHALLKQRQGIRGTHEEHENAARDAVGDIVVFLTDLCSARGWDFASIVDATWAEVRERDWVATRAALDGGSDER